MGFLPLYNQNWKKKIESNTIDVMDKMNFTKLNAPAPKKGSPNAMVSRADWPKESDPPMKSRTTFSIDQPSQL